MWIDSHAHYSHMKFEECFRYLARGDGAYRVEEGKREDVLAALRAIGVSAVVEPAIGPESNEKLLALSAAHPGFLYPAVGVHPTRAAQVKRKDLPLLRRYAASPNVVAIGETGLDYDCHGKKQHRVRQKLMFLYQIRLADAHKLPLILHIRAAYGDAIRILKLRRKKLHGGVAHCFTGTKEEALALIDLGFHLGIGGALLKSDERAAALREVVRAVPLERLLAETDAPYVLPDVSELRLGSRQRRNLRNTSLILPAVVEQIAALKGIDAARAERVVYENTAAVFGLPL